MVTNEVYDREWGNIDNRRVMESIVATYKNLTRDEKTECMQIGLWNALKKYVDGKGEKLTTRLYRFVGWECKRKLRQCKKNRIFYMSELPEVEVVQHDRHEDIQYVMECMQRLPEVDREMLTHRYLEDMTFPEIGRRYSFTKQAAKYHVKAAVERLQEICLT